MANSIIDMVCNSCSCNKQSAEEHLNDEIRNLNELKELDDLGYSDLESACESLGLDYDCVEYFINALAS